jgi:hypothetical protein
LIVENSLFSGKPHSNRNTFSLPAPNTGLQTPDNPDILAIAMKNASLYYPQIFYKTQIWGNQT